MNKGKKLIFKKARETGRLARRRGAWSNECNYNKGMKRHHESWLEGWKEEDARIRDAASHPASPIADGANDARHMTPTYG